LITVCGAVGEGDRLYRRPSALVQILVADQAIRHVVTPGSAIVWYETVIAFLAEHVLDEEWQRPELL
jgi:hypothetical protein